MAAEFKTTPARLKKMLEQLEGGGAHPGQRRLDAADCAEEETVAAAG